MLNHCEGSVDRLYEAILRLDSKEECRSFFEDLCTIREILDMAQRLETAMLLDSKMSYLDIAKDLKISTATIGRVSKCLHYGSGGYRLVLDKLKEKGDDA
ncbi:MAG: TrpR-related protein YerC/YecD [Clostridia bacterium]|nr:TrpR-related protein YerC/YecD [Clostridia bacterium]MBR3553238.1 TrpR-related protein YerC/YecD [Clostridia bacterium]